MLKQEDVFHTDRTQVSAGGVPARLRERVQEGANKGVVRDHRLNSADGVPLLANHTVPEEVLFCQASLIALKTHKKDVGKSLEYVVDHQHEKSI